MASAFGHAFTAIVIRSGYNKITSFKTMLLGIFCAVIPDADIISFKFGIPYESFWGHRGFTHSLTFAILLALLITILFFNRQLKEGSWFNLFLFFFLCTASHGFLDAMTNGGLGVAFFSPWNNTRYFLPWRPIKVSPLNAGSFFSDWGIQVLWSELVYIGIPGFLFISVIRINKYFTERH